MGDDQRLLIGTLYSGENEFEQCLESLQAQSYRNWEHRIFRDLPNREAHETLYREFMSSSESFDLFLKLDADMVFTSDDSLRTIVRCFTEDPDLDHLASVVHDWYSDTLIMGLQIFSRRARLSVSDDVFVDSAPEAPGKRMQMWGTPAPFARHSPDPSDLQAFKFGVHRASKIVQRGRSDFHVGQAKTQWAILIGTWRHFERCGDKRLGLALLGAEQVFEGTLNHGWYGNIESIEQRSDFQRFGSLTVDEIMREIKPRWSSPLVRGRRYVQLTGYRRVAKLTNLTIRRALIKLRQTLSLVKRA